MKKTYLWKLVPLGLPPVLRYCPKCGCTKEFECSRNFRVNANKNSLNIWLIYKCCKCKTTWNMNIITKADCQKIDKEFYNKCINNDQELADYYAFDACIHNKNKAVCNYENVPYNIMGNDINMNDIIDANQIRLECSYPTEIRLDKILSEKLCVSRNLIKKMIKSGSIYCKGQNTDRIRLNKGLLITILPYAEELRDFAN